MPGTAHCACSKVKGERTRWQSPDRPLTIVFSSCWGSKEVETKVRTDYNSKQCAPSPTSQQGPSAPSTKVPALPAPPVLSRGSPHPASSLFLPDTHLH